MDSKNELRHELADLNLLLRGLAKISAFPSDLLELILGKVESITRLTLPSEEEEVTEEADRSYVVTETMSPNLDIHPLMSDLTRSLTLNDRFRIQRELFGNDSKKMTEVFSEINKTQSKEEALDYLRNVCTVDESSDCYQDFCMMLQLHFTRSSGKSSSN